MVVCGCDLQHTCAVFGVNVTIANYGNSSANTLYGRNININNKGDNTWSTITHIDVIYGQHCPLSDQVFEPCIIWVDAYGWVSQNSLRPGGSHRQESTPILQPENMECVYENWKVKEKGRYQVPLHVFEVVHGSFLFEELHLQVWDRWLEFGRPIHESTTSIKQSVIMETHKRLHHRLVHLTLNTEDGLEKKHNKRMNCKLVYMIKQVYFDYIWV